MKYMAWKRKDGMSKEKWKTKTKTHSIGEKQTIEPDSDMVQMLELIDKEFKITDKYVNIINVKSKQYQKRDLLCKQRDGNSKNQKEW